MVDRDSRLGQVYPKPAMAAYRRGQSLKDLLCRAKLPILLRKSGRQASKQGFANCGQLCVLCPFAKNSRSHMVADKEFKINGMITCSSRGCVYKIMCQKCLGFVYYGETGRELRTRFREHRGDIDNNRPKPVSEHFNKPGHTLGDLIFIGIERVIPTDDAFRRKQRESFYIRRANSMRNGANRRFWLLYANCIFLKKKKNHQFHVFRVICEKASYHTILSYCIEKAYTIGERSIQIQTKSKSLVANHLLLIREAVQSTWNLV